jgi:hypothetical protein
MKAKDVIVKFLEDRGLRYSIQDDNVLFKYQLVNYVMINNSNEDLLQLVMLFFDVTPENHLQALSAVNEINQMKAIVKLTVVDDSIWVNIEDIVNDNYDVDKLEKYFDLMENAVKAFYDYMKNNSTEK